jgi:hypothetical protein
MQLVNLANGNLIPTSASQRSFQSDRPLMQQALRCNLRIMDAEYRVAWQYDVAHFFRKEGRPARRAVCAVVD